MEAVKKEIVMTVKRDNPEEKLKDFWSQATSTRTLNPNPNPNPKP